MSSTSGNPFVFPGMGLGQPPGDPSGNPILQSMEMMRQAWSSLGGAAMPFGSAMPANPILHPEELERRVQELQAVANWLRLNLSMLESSIQALEVQRATFATLQSFAGNMGAAMGAQPQAAATSPAGPSPLDIALAAKPGPRTAQAATKPAAKPQPEPAAQPAEPAAAPDVSPQQAWWNLLQNQFSQIASAAAATLPGAEQMAAAAKPARKAAATDAAPRKAARKRAPRKSV